MQTSRALSCETTPADRPSSHHKQTGTEVPVCILMQTDDRIARLTSLCLIVSPTVSGNMSKTVEREAQHR